MKRQKPSVPCLSFLGATGTVTGSRFLIETAGARVLVDCGLFQGLKALRVRNWADLPGRARRRSTRWCSHTRISTTRLSARVGAQRIPRFHLCHRSGTRALCRIVLPDSGHLQEEEAAYANRKGYSKHTPALPLYTEDEATRVLQQFAPLPFGVVMTWRRISGSPFDPAGHILGSAIAARRDRRRRRRARVVFSGDLGRPHHPILLPPAPLPAADFV